MRGDCRSSAHGATRIRLVPDRLTLITVAALAYVVNVALHEHAGHAAACVMLGSRVLEFGAFYVNCDDARLGATAVRLVALAGPTVSLLVGIAGFLALRAIDAAHGIRWYFTWLTGSLGLMTSTGYMLASGVSGIGDLGFDADSALGGATPQWAWRAALIVAGAVSYYLSVRLAARTIDPHLSGAGPSRVSAARRMLLVSYVTGAVVYLVIGVLNPYGLVIVATSALASSMGGTSALLWMQRLFDRGRDVSPPGLTVPRSWGWIGASLLTVAAYGVVLGPTLRPRAEPLDSGPALQDRVLVAADQQFGETRKP